MTDTIDTTTPTEEVNTAYEDLRARELADAMRLLDLHTGEFAVLVDDLNQIIHGDGEWWATTLIVDWTTNPGRLANTVTHLTAMAKVGIGGDQRLRDWLDRVTEIERRRGFDHRLEVAPAHRIAPGLDGAR